MPTPAEMERFLEEARLACLAAIPKRRPWWEMAASKDRWLRRGGRDVLAMLRWEQQRFRARDMGFKEAIPFVDKTIGKHMNLIRRWDGLRLVGEPIEMEDTEEQGRRFDEIVRASRETKSWKAARAAAAKMAIAIHQDYIGHTQLGFNALISRTLKSQYARKHLIGSKKTVNVRYLYTSLVSRIEGAVAPVGGFDSTVRVGERVAAAILDDAKKYIGPVFPEYVRYLEELFRMLGEQLWSATTRPVTPVISVAPSDFLLLGNLRCDEGSCFGTRGGNRGNKINLASRVTDSFVLFFYRDRKTKKLTKDRNGLPRSEFIAGRGWGFRLPSAIIASNFYGLLREDVQPVYRNFLEGALGKKIEKELDGVDAQREVWFKTFAQELSKAIYFNSDSHFLLTEAAKKSDLPKELTESLNTVALRSSAEGDEAWLNDDEDDDRYDGW